MKNLFGLGTIFAFYVLLRFSYLLFGVETRPAPFYQGTASFSETFLYNLLSLPLKLFSNVVIPRELLLPFSRQVTTISFFESFPSFAGPWRQDLAFVYDSITIFLGLLILASVLLLRRKKRIRRALYIGSALVVLTAIPLFALNKYLVFLDSRFLYPATVGVSIILAGLLDLSLSKTRSVKALILVSILLISHLVFLEIKIGELVNIGRQRQKILGQIKEFYPTLGEKTVFFAESDTTFYGLPQRIFPFQSGLGQTLLVYYYQDQSIPEGFFAEEFLWDITSQGYKEVDNFGFGFFWDFAELAKVVLEKNINLNSIYAIAYDSEMKEALLITERTQGEIVSLESEKRRVNLSGAKISSSHNPKEAYLAIDGKRSTVWNSGAAYAIPQYLEIDMGRQVRVAEVKIDSFDNKDQTEVGYAIWLSDNGEDWKEVFRDKRRTPGGNGLVDILLLPTKGRYIKIEQIGFHEYAHWVIHELEIYEANE